MLVVRKNVLKNERNKDVDNSDTDLRRHVDKHRQYWASMPLFAVGAPVIELDIPKFSEGELIIFLLAKAVHIVVFGIDIFCT